MRTVSRISHWFVFAGLVAASGLIGWVARSTWAHNIPRQPVYEIQIPKPPAHEILELAQAQDEPPLPRAPARPATPDALIPATPSLGTENSTSPVPQDLTATRPEPQPLSELPVASSLPAQPVSTIAVNPATSTDSEDPEKAVQSFVEQNQKLAETQLKNLRDEQAKLRARLQKVEAGIKRWEVLVEALKLSKKGSVVSSESRLQLVPKTTDDTPDVLDAIPKSRIGPPSQPK